MTATITLRIDDLAGGGDGVSRLPSGKVCFIPRTAPGDLVDVRLVHEARREARGEVVRIIEPGPGRRVPSCPYQDLCGGCELAHLTIEAQRAAKGRVLARALRLEHEPEVVPSPDPLGYRQLARLQAEPRAGGGLRLGFLARGSHEIVDVSSCQCLAPDLRAALPAVRELLTGIPGLAAVRLARAGAVPVVAIELDGRPPVELYESARALVPDRLAGVVVVTDGVRLPIAGSGEARLGAADGGELVTPAPGFGQANAGTNRLLGDRLAAIASGKRHTRTLELFAGAGNFSVVLAAAGAHLTAVEQSEPAAKAINVNLQRRGLGAAHTVAGEALTVLGAIPGDFELAVLDPPRGGHLALCRALAKRRPARIAYVSCDPATLGRDLAVFLAAGYERVEVVGFDMFPETPHLEALVELRRVR